MTNYPLTLLLFKFVFLIDIMQAVDFKYYIKSSQNKPVSREQSMADDGLKTVYIIHGYLTRELSAPHRLKDKIFKNVPDVGRVVIVDWWFRSTSLSYPDVAFVEVPKVADKLAKEVIKFRQAADGRCGAVEFIGHSLGTHVAGQAGAKLITSGQEKVAQIIGLDPAGIIIEITPKFLLKSSDATHVKVIHTNTKRYGIDKDLGHEDIYPNGGRLQKGCIEKLTDDICSHSKAWELYEQYLAGAEIVDPKDKSKGKNQPPTPRQISLNILVLDVSPSMQENGQTRIKSLVISANRFVDELPIGAYLGVIVFGGYGIVAHHVTNVSDENVRNSLKKSLPTVKTQIYATSIGAGLTAAIDALNAFHGTGANCPNILLITDGQENRRPWIRDVTPKFSKLCAKIQCIGLGTLADAGLERLSQQTGGKIFYVSDQTDGTYDRLTESLLDSSTASQDPDHQPIKLPVKILKLGPNTESAKFLIDNSIGKNTRFSISSDQLDKLDIDLISPAGIIFGPSDYRLDIPNKQISMSFPNAENGDWEVKLKSKVDNATHRRKRSHQNTGDVISAKVFVTTNQKSDDVEPIRLDVYLSNHTIEYPDWVTIHAEVRKGYDAIIGADVEAHIISQSGNITKLTLWDNGAGADLTRDDGIYSRFITHLCEGNGKRYEIIVFASDKNGEARIRPNGPYDLMDIEVNDKNLGTFESTYKFERQRNVGSLKAIGKYERPGPTPVRDLRIISVDENFRVIGLQWTASGDSGDTGMAAAVYIATSTFNNDSHNFTEFVFNISSKSPDIVNGSLIPVEGGKIQRVDLQIPVDIWNRSIEMEMVKSVLGPFKLFFTVRTESRNGKNSESNLARLSPDLIVANDNTNVATINLKTNIVSTFVVAVIFINLIH